LFICFILKARHLQEIVQKINSRKGISSNKNERDSLNQSLETWDQFNESFRSSDEFNTAVNKDLLNRSIDRSHVLRKKSSKLIDDDIDFQRDDDYYVFIEQEIRKHEENRRLSVEKSVKNKRDELVNFKRNLL